MIQDQVIFNIMSYTDIILNKELNLFYCVARSKTQHQLPYREHIIRRTKVSFSHVARADFSKHTFQEQNYITRRTELTSLYATRADFYLKTEFTFNVFPGEAKIHQYHQKSIVVQNKLN